LVVATVAGFGVSVIAAFKAFGAEFEVAAVYAIAAGRSLANVGAGIARVSIAVVAGFTVVYTRVPTDFPAALGVATVTCLGVSVVASFALIEAVVAAAFQPAEPITAIASVLVSIVASFVPGAQCIIAARCQSAAV
jgi:hypothetical protein